MRPIRRSARRSVGLLDGLLDGLLGSLLGSLLDGLLDGLLDTENGSIMFANNKTCLVQQTGLQEFSTGAFYGVYEVQSLYYSGL